MDTTVDGIDGDAIEAVLDAANLADERPRETFDARDLPPPEPLRGTLERLAELDDGAVLVQVNDRAPQHLYPRLEERDYRYETREIGAVVVTVVWR